MEPCSLYLHNYNEIQIIDDHFKSSQVKVEWF